MQPPLILIDGSSYFYRAFHALPPLTNTKGQATGAVYGVINMVKRLIKDHQPEHLAMVFDAKGKTFRDEWYPEYKAHRPSMPPELSSQFEPMIQFLQAMGLALLMVEGVEADDVIATLATEAAARGQKVLISTGDKDMAQLVTESITLVNTMSNHSLDIPGVKDKFGVLPNQIIDYLSLVGDSSDNIPGVPNCGPKTAAKWLAQYQTLENLVAHADEISGKIGESLRNNLPMLPLAKRLVTLKTDVALPMSLDELGLKPRDTATLISIAEALEFKTWLKELKTADKVEDSPPSEQQVILVKTEAAFEDLLAELARCEQPCLSLETEGSECMQAELVGLTLALGDNKVYYLPITPEMREASLTILAPYLKKATLTHDVKWAYHVFNNHGLTLRQFQHDTLLESYLLNAAASRHDLDSLALKYLGHPLDEAKKDQANIILQLHQLLFSKLDAPLKKVLEDIEMPLTYVLADMERHGVLIDTEALFKHGQRLKERLATLEKEALALSGQPFNLNSPKQLQEILFEIHKLPVLAKTPTGQASTAESVLQELALDYPLPALILEYRSLSKLVSTYIDTLPKRVNPKTGRVHTNYNQAVAATGRLSSSDPNLQNIPIRSEEGRLIRKAFIAPADCQLLAADYSQIELRIMAHLSLDPNLLLAFSNNWDIHSATASEIFQVPLAEVSQEQRRRAKAVNFGLIYGMSAFGLARQLGVDRKDAQHYIDRYFERYPNVLAYMERTREQAHQQGYVETIFGRRLLLPDINVRHLGRQRAAERAAINAPMQGSAADIIKRAMLAIAAWQSSPEGQGVAMIMQVHDELVFEVEKSRLDSATLKIRELMEETTRLSVPLSVSIGVGDNWDEAH